MKSWLNRWRAAAATAALSALTGCNGTSVPTPPAVTERAALQSFGGTAACTDLEGYIEDTAVLQMRTQLEAARDGVPSWGWWGGWGFRGGIDDVAFPQAAGASNSKGSTAPSSYTTTNNQVAGVDEADFVKNDGTRIFVLSGQTLNAVKSWPADQLSLQGTLQAATEPIAGYTLDMFYP